MNLAQIRVALRIELADTGALWTDDELDRAVEKAVTDIDRLFPLEAFKEITFKPEVKNESWTAAASAGTWVSLANKPIAYGSEEVKDNAGTVCTRDTDYYIDYTAGKITHISGGKISNGEICSISYEKSKVAVDISALDVIRIQRVEYPYGKVPQSFESYEVFGDILFLTGIETAGQQKLSDGKHIVIYYLTKNTLPTMTASGSFPRHLDSIMLKGSAAYACLTKALQYEHSAGAILDSISFTKTETALDKVATVLGGVDAYLTGAAAPSARKYLDDGDAYLTTVNLAANVAENYAIYASRSSDIAVALTRQAAEYNNEAGSRLTNLDRQLARANQFLALADRFRVEGTDRRNEFLALLSDRAQLRGKSVVTVSPRQIKA